MSTSYLKPSLFILLGFFSWSLNGQLSITVESGLFFSGSNDVRVPNGNTASGTLFSLQDDFSPLDSRPHFRAELAYLFNDRHTVELTAAPLVISYEKGAPSDISFAGQVFSGESIEGTYEFNTYRASYRYRLWDKPKFKFDLGASVLVRDARIALEDASQNAEDTDLGFVPLISFNMVYHVTDGMALLLKGDALVGPQGRAEDVFAGFLINAYQNKLHLRAGYRIIEGGADVDQVYNFALIHFASVGLSYTL